MFIEDYQITLVYGSKKIPWTFPISGHDLWKATCVRVTIPNSLYWQTYRLTLDFWVSDDNDGVLKVFPFTTLDSFPTFKLKLDSPDIREDLLRELSLVMREHLAKKQKDYDELENRLRGGM